LSRRRTATSSSRVLNSTASTIPSWCASFADHPANMSLAADPPRPLCACVRTETTRKTWSTSGSRSRVSGPCGPTPTKVWP
jgi:hypothetical protein